MDTNKKKDPASLDDTILWTPTPEDISRSNLTAFMDANGIATFDELMSRSTQDVAWFTDALLKFLGIRFSTPYERVVDVDPDDWRRPVWCPGGRMNITVSCVDRWLETEETARRLALIAEMENGEVRELTYAELAVEVARCANALTELGHLLGNIPRPGDSVDATLGTSAAGDEIEPPVGSDVDVGDRQRLSGQKDFGRGRLPRPGRKRLERENPPVRPIA